MPSLPRVALACALVLLAGLAPARAAHASSTQLSIMQDDDHLLYRGDATRDATLRKMKALGVDMVRVTVLWSAVADQIDTKPVNAKQAKLIKKNHKRFVKDGANDPRAYPEYNWDKYDRLDKACQTLQIICYFDVTGPGPTYSHPKPPKKYRKDAYWWKPSPTAFYKFVQAVGRRYSGTYPDGNDGHGILPAVRVWSIWNEPNQGGWLRPQWINGKAVSPSLYRNLYTYGLRALISTGHDPTKADSVYIGETSPLNVARKTDTSEMGPKTFINELLCGPGSGGLGCGTFAKTGPLVATAWAHHPYTKTFSPLQSDPDPTAITMHNLSDLGTELDQLAASTGHIRSGMPYISTEYGYETNPPDPTATTSFANQSLYLQLGDFLTEQNPRVLGNTQFLLDDAKPNKHFKKNSRPYWGTYQSGLYNSSGTVAKTAASTYPFPFLAIPGAADPATGRPTYTVWGQPRFAPDFVPGAQSVTIEYSADAVNWAPVGPVAVNSVKGFFDQAGIETPGPGLIRASYGGLHSAPQPVS